MRKNTSYLVGRETTRDGQICADTDPTVIVILMGDFQRWKANLRGDGENEIVFNI
jgi:hypothetical protein